MPMAAAGEWQRGRMGRRQFLGASAAAVLGLSVTGRAGTQAPAEKALPARLPADRIDGPPIVSARAWAIGDGKTGRVLWSAHESDRLSMASTTKIMTAAVVLKMASDDARVLDEIVVVSEQAARTPGSSARIKTGDRLPVRELLYGLLLPSGNDAAAALAEHFGPRCRGEQEAAPVAAFVAQMNRHAQALELSETRYLDPHGLGGNLTSARDLIRLAWHALKQARFREYVQTRRHRYEISDAGGDKREVVWNNSNQLLGIEGYDGIKTGTTTAAGFCLVGSGRRDEDHLLVVVLGSTSNDSRYVDARNLFRWGWQQRERR
jgi:serine-type D-Ala-D-Ala carboxypeptidase (penicillin-binding protein 5/6)